MLRDGPGGARGRSGANGSATAGAACDGAGAAGDGASAVVSETGAVVNGAGADVNGTGAAVNGAGARVPAPCSGADSVGADLMDSLALCRLDAAALNELGREALLGVLSDIERLTNQLAGYRAEVLGVLETLSRSGAAPDVTPHLTLRDSAGMSEREARKMIRTASKAREHRGVLEALTEGDINAAQAEALCDARVPDRVRDGLVAAAVCEDTDATRRRVRQAEAEHCDETATERLERQRRARNAGWRRDHEGMLKLWAKFDPEVGAHVEAGLGALQRRFWADDKKVRNGRRSPGQRDADVLAYALAGITLTDADAAAVERLHTSAVSAERRNGQMPSGGRPVPTEDAAGRSGTGRSGTGRSGSGRSGTGRSGSGRSGPGRSDTGTADAAGQGNCGCDSADTAGAVGDYLTTRRHLPPAQINVLIGLDALRGRTDEAGVTDSGVELPPETVRRLACDSEIIPMILGGPGGSADVGRARRTVSLRLRRLLIARDRHCRWPGCDAPPSRCDAHHILHWIDDGPTDLDNLLLLCRTHHQHLHEHGYKLVPGAGGGLTPIRRTGGSSAAENQDDDTHAYAQRPRAP